MTEPRAPVIYHLQFLQTNTGLLVGTLVLIGAWLLLQFLGRHGSNMGSRLAAALRRPVLFGLQKCGLTVFEHTSEPITLQRRHGGRTHTQLKIEPGTV